MSTLPYMVITFRFEVRQCSRAIATAVVIALFAPAFAVAQAPKVPRVGMIFGGSSTDPLNLIRRQALRDTGYVEGQTIQTSGPPRHSASSSLTRYECERTR